MDLAPAQLAALVAIADHGTFEAAARAAARDAVGGQPADPGARVRGRPGRRAARRRRAGRPRPASVLLRLARQTRLLHDEVRGRARARPRRPGRPAGRGQRRLAGDLVPRRARRGRRAGTDVALRLHVEDQAYSADLLRSGEVLAAVTSDPSAVQGCSVEHARRAALPSRPRPRSSPSGGGAGRGPTGRRMPMVVFNEKDELQHDVLARPGRRPAAASCTGCRPRPTSSRRSGSGWAGAMLPEPQLLPDLDAGRLVALGAPAARRRAPALAALAARLAGAGPPHRRRTPRRRAAPRR